MSTNCLVTKLKGVVDNDNLLELGELRFRVNVPAEDAAANSLVRFSCLGTITVKLSDPTKNIVVNGSNVGSTYDFLTVAEFTLEAGEYYVSIIPKYRLQSLNTLPKCIPTDSLIDLEDLKYSPLTYILAGGATAKLKGNIENLAGKNMTGLIINNSTGVYGDFATACGAMTSLTDFRFDLTDVTGSIESFVAAQRAAGRTSYSFSNILYLGASKLTFNGAAIANQKDNALSWDATTITLNGTTINA